MTIALVYFDYPFELGKNLPCGTCGSDLRVWSNLRISSKVRQIRLAAAVWRQNFQTAEVLLSVATSKKLSEILEANRLRDLGRRSLALPCPCPRVLQPRHSLRQSDTYEVEMEKVLMTSLF